MSTETTKPETGNTAKPEQPSLAAAKPKETGGPKGLEPTRYGDWEAKGKCVDF